MRARHDSHVSWFDEYPRLVILILSSTNLPRSLQEVLGTSLIETTESYLAYLWQHHRVGQVIVQPFWNLYLRNRQPYRWESASPLLHQAFSRILLLPEPILQLFEDRCDHLVNDLCYQILTGSVDIQHSTEEIRHFLRLERSAIESLCVGYGTADLVPQYVDMKKAEHYHRMRSRVSSAS